MRTIKIKHEKIIKGMKMLTEVVMELTHRPIKKNIILDAKKYMVFIVCQIFSHRYSE